ncbi:MAG: SAM-dependent methyltransferase [Candidatus Omnitrophica bacterium]|nr:SAM-dependent methyltransferase [Candidatus Omnitrophota bacterium]
MKIHDEVANILANSRIDGDKLFLPDEQLDRKLYLNVNKVLTSMHGKWDRKARAHIFKESPVNIIDNILLSGEYTDQKKEFQFFETPHGLAEKLVGMAKIKKGETVLEPSAGKARIAKLIDGCHCIELNQENRKFLIKSGFIVVGEDFMDFNECYDVIIANPPFTKQQDVDHINRMIDLAKRRIVSVSSASVLFRTNKKTKLFRARIDKLGGIIEMLPGRTFTESGTNVQACVVCVDV